MIIFVMVLALFMLFETIVEFVKLEHTDHISLFITAVITGLLFVWAAKIWGII